MSDSHDREMILRRRLAFVASALSGLSIGRVVSAQPAVVEACADAAPPTAEDVARADSLFASGVAAQQAGRPSEAANASVTAYQLVPNTKHLVAAARSLLDADDSFAAFLLIAEHLRCRGDVEELMPIVAKLETTTGGVKLDVFGDQPWELTIDQRPVPRPLQSLVIRLPPGKHVISIVSPSYTPPTVTVDVAIDEIKKVRLDSVPPMPCLSMMHPSRREGFVELAVGAVAPVVIDTRLPVSVGGGGGIRGAIAVQFTSGGWFNADVFTLLTAPPTTGFALSSADVRYYPESSIGFGAGFSGGFATSGDPTPLWGPTVIPLAIVYEALRVELRVPCWFDDEPDRGLLYVAPQVFVGIGLPVLEREE